MRGKLYRTEPFLASIYSRTHFYGSVWIQHTEMSRFLVQVRALIMNRGNMWQVFGRLLETAGSRAAVGAYAAALSALAASLAPRLPAELTAWFVRLEDDRKYQRDVGGSWDF